MRHVARRSYKMFVREGMGVVKMNDVTPEQLADILVNTAKSAREMCLETGDDVPVWVTRIIATPIEDHVARFVRYREYAKANPAMFEDPEADSDG